MSEEPYNPLDKRNLGASVAEAMLGREVHSLGKLDEFKGAGIYAIYYTGNFDAYKPIRERNAGGKWQAPIYVGKAVPAGARKGNVGLSHAGETTVLFKRLRGCDRAGTCCIPAVRGPRSANNVPRARIRSDRM